MYTYIDTIIYVYIYTGIQICIYKCVCVNVCMYMKIQIKPNKWFTNLESREG